MQEGTCGARTLSLHQRHGQTVQSSIYSQPTSPTLHMQDRLLISFAFTSHLLVFTCTFHNVLHASFMTCLYTVFTRNFPNVFTCILHNMRTRIFHNVYTRTFHTPNAGSPNSSFSAAGMTSWHSPSCTRAKDLISFVTSFPYAGVMIEPMIFQGFAELPYLSACQMEVSIRKSALKIHGYGNPAKPWKIMGSMCRSKWKAASKTWSWLRHHLLTPVANLNTGICQARLEWRTKVHMNIEAVFSWDCSQSPQNAAAA